MTAEVEKVQNVIKKAIEEGIPSEDSEEEEELFNLYCPTCLLSFTDNVEYKTHYKSEIHNYNMKRKLLNLRPANPEEFRVIKKSKYLFLI